MVEQYASPAINPKRDETIIIYEIFAAGPLTKEMWTKTRAIDSGNIVKGHKATITPGANNDFFLEYDEIKNIPADR